MLVAEDIVHVYTTPDAVLRHGAWYDLFDAASIDWPVDGSHRAVDLSGWTKWIDGCPSFTPTRKICAMLQYIPRLPYGSFTAASHGMVWALGSIVTPDVVPIPEEYHVVWGYLRRLALRSPHPTVAWARRNEFIISAVTEAAQYPVPVAASIVRLISWSQYLLWIDVLIRLCAPSLIEIPYAEGS